MSITEHEYRVRHCVITAEVMRPPSITTAASISPWREVPQPVYVPSFHLGAGGGAGSAGATTGATGSTAAAGGGGATGPGVKAGAAASTGAGTATASGTAATVVDSGLPGASRFSCGVTDATREDALGSSWFTGRNSGLGDAGRGCPGAAVRLSACTSNWLAADRVRAYPAV